MGEKLRFPTAFLGSVVLLTASAVLAAMALAAWLGDFSRDGVAFLMFVLAGLLLLMGFITTTLPLADSYGGSPWGLNFANTMSNELLLEQSLRNPKLRPEEARRRRVVIRLLTAGGLLIVLALLVA
ncbi:MAG: hypothetical protein AB7J35_18475 [Dehalococcoidia bacterium]